MFPLLLVSNLMKTVKQVFKWFYPFHACSFSSEIGGGRVGGGRILGSKHPKYFTALG